MKLLPLESLRRASSLTRAHAIVQQDGHCQIIYTFNSKKKADEFYKIMKKSLTE